MSPYDNDKKEDDGGLKMLFLGLGLIVSGFLMDLFAFGKRSRISEMSEEDEMQRILASSVNVSEPEASPNLPGNESFAQSVPSEFIGRQVNQRRESDPDDGLYVPANKSDEGAYQAVKALEKAKLAADVLKIYKTFRATQDDEWMTGFWEELGKQNPEMADYIEKSYMQPFGGTTNECHPSKFEELNNGIIPDDMRIGLERAGAPLSDKATVSVKRKDISWIINDGEKTYTIWKENGRISIYMPRLTFGTKDKPYTKNGFHTKQDYVDLAQDIRKWFEELGTPPQEVAAAILRRTEGWQREYANIIYRHQLPEVRKIIRRKTRSWW